MPFPKLNIRQRLPLFISASALLILLLEGFFIYEYSAYYHEREFRKRMEARLATADSLIARDRLHPVEALSELPPDALPEEKIFYLNDSGKAVLPEGQLLLSNSKDSSRHGPYMYNFAHIGQRDYAFHRDSLNHATLVVSAVDRYGISKLHRLQTGIIGGILLGVLLLALATWFWVKKMLQPVADKISRAQAIGAKSLNLRLEVKDNNDELDQLARTFNQMLDRLEKSFLAQQQFIRNASHEMRTPLTAIVAEADLALLQNRDPAAYRTALENIRTRAEGLEELLGRLLYMARLDGDAPIAARDCNADEILLSALQTLQLKYPQAAHRVQVQLDAPDSVALVLHGDPGLLQAAYFNLLDNAVKYGAEKPVLVQLKIAGNMVCLLVSDAGQGILPDEMPHLFEPFYRSSRHVHLPGSGIGLPLVKSIAEKYGGNISVDSTPGAGTTIRLCFPLAGKL